MEAISDMLGFYIMNAGNKESFLWRCTIEVSQLWGLGGAILPTYSPRLKGM